MTSYHIISLLFLIRMVFEADSITLLVNAGTRFPKLSAVAIFSFIFPHISYTKLPASYAVSNSPAVQMMVIIQRNAHYKSGKDVYLSL